MWNQEHSIKLLLDRLSVSESLDRGMSERSGEATILHMERETKEIRRSTMYGKQDVIDLCGYR